MSTGVLRNNWCDCCDPGASGEPSLHPVRALLDGDGVDPVVAPGAVDVQVPRSEADLAQPELLDDPQGVGVLGSDGDLDPVQAGGEEAVVDRHRDRTRHYPAA